MIYDKNIQWKRKRIFIPSTSLVGGSVGAGTPVIQEISTFGVRGVLVDTAGDDVAHLWMLPYDLDITSSIGVRVWWTSAAAAVGDRTIDWKVLYKPLIPGTTAIAVPSTALDTIITAGQAPAGTAYVLERSARGQIDADTIGATAQGMIFLVEMDAFDAAFTEDKYIVGVEIDYAVRATFLEESRDQSGNLNRDIVEVRTDEQQYVADLGSTATAI